MARLIIEKAEDTAQRGQGVDLIAGGAPTSIGRGEGCELTLNDQRASKVHCTVSLKFGTWFLEDNESRNGTVCRDERVTRLALRDGDRIRIGSAVVQFSADGTEFAAGKREIAGCRPDDLLSTSGGVVRVHAWQLALDRAVRIDQIHPGWDCFSASDPYRELAVDAVEQATAAAAELEHPGIAGFLSATIPGDPGGHVLMRPTGESLLSQVPGFFGVGVRLALVRRLVEAYLERAAHPALRSPIGLDGIGIHSEDGPILPPMELYACLAEARRASVHLPELIPYLPPETIRDCAKSPEDAREDGRSFERAAYNLGAIAYHLITASPPMGEGDAEKVLRNHLRLEAAPPDAIDPEIPEPVSEIIRRLLAKDPAQRPTSAEEILEPFRNAAHLEVSQDDEDDDDDDWDEYDEEEGTAEGEEVEAAAARPTPAARRPQRGATGGRRLRSAGPPVWLWLVLCVPFWVVLFFAARWGVARLLIERFGD